MLRVVDFITTLSEAADTKQLQYLRVYEISVITWIIVHSNHITENKTFVLVWLLHVFSPPFNLILNSE